MLAEDFLDHHIERLCGRSLRLPDQAAQTLEILRGIAQAVDVVEPQSLQPVFRDQPFDEAMHGVEGAGVLDAQSGERVDVEEAPIVDVAGGQPPMAELVMLAFQQMVQRRDVCAAPGPAR